MEGPLGRFSSQRATSSTDEIDQSESRSGCRATVSKGQLEQMRSVLKSDVGSWPCATRTRTYVESHGDDLDVPKDDGRLDLEVSLVAFLVMLVMKLL